MLPLNEAIVMARSAGVDLVEIAPNATPPVCRLVDYGKYRYEQSKKDKESKKHQHANKVKEVQLSATIDPHDFGVKVDHAVDFLCDDMKVKVSLRFRGREMAHTEFGFQVVRNFIQKVLPWGHPDAEPKLIGRGLNVMLSPLPRNKRAKHPRGGDSEPGTEAEPGEPGPETRVAAASAKHAVVPIERDGPEQPAFGNNPFSQLDAKMGGS